MTRRRPLLASLLAFPAVGVRAQQPLPVIGWLNPSQPEGGVGVAAFLQGLASQGFVAGNNVAIEYAWARGDYERLPALAAELVAHKVALIASGPLNSTLAARDATVTIPIVFTIGVDPVAYGLVASLNRPGGNITGVAQLLGELWPKRLQLVHELLPKATKVGVLFNPNNTNFKSNMQSLQKAALSLGIELSPISTAGENEMEATLTSPPMRNVDALFVADDPHFSALGGKLAELTTRHRVPAIYFDRAFAASGGLISYGPGIASMFAKTGEYVGRVLKGAKPADLPVEQPTKFELVINLKTAKALGLTIPPSILARADEVIE